MKDKMLWFAIENLWALMVYLFAMVAEPALREGESPDQGFIRLMSKAIEIEREKT